MKELGIKIILSLKFVCGRCLGLTRVGIRCKRVVINNNKFCFQHQKKKLTFIDLFAGAGGFSSGFVKVGFKPLLFLDSNKDCCSTLESNYLNSYVINNYLKNVNLEAFKKKVDVLLGGTPCQSFSQIGLKAGLLDSNGESLIEFIQVIFKLLPKVFIIENVRGLFTHNKGKTFQYILNLLCKDNLYNIEYDIINMADYGVPQNRVRLFIVGKLNYLTFKVFPLAKVNKKQTLRSVLFNVPESKGFKYPLYKIKLFKQIPQGGCWVNLPLEIQKSYLGKSFNSSGGKRGVLRRLSLDEPSLTLMCSPSQKQTERCHPLENRPLTLKEYSRVQTFPDTFVFKGSVSSQYRQIGNAVPPRFSQVLALSLLKKLKFSSTRNFSSGNCCNSKSLPLVYQKKVKSIVDECLSKELVELKRNQVDDILLSRFSDEERKAHLKIHNASMLHGEIWHKVFSLDTGYCIIDGLDLKNEYKLEVVELKNKSSTLNSDSKKQVYFKLADFVKKNPGYSCVLGFINSNIPTKTFSCFNNTKILVLSSDFLFEHFWGCG